MKLKIEKVPATGELRVELAYDPARKPIVLEGQQLESLLSMLDVARRAERFRIEVEVKG